MLLKALFYLLYLLVLVPIGWVRRPVNHSRFGPGFHRGPTSWDRT